MCSRLRLTDSPGQYTRGDTLDGLDKAEDDKVSQDSLGVLVVDRSAFTLKNVESEDGGWDESQELGNGECEAKQVERDEQEVTARQSRLFDSDEKSRLRDRKLTRIRQWRQAQPCPCPSSSLAP